jgi:hypothetical protein
MRRKQDWKPKIVTRLVTTRSRFDNIVCGADVVSRSSKSIVASSIDGRYLREHARGRSHEVLAGLLGKCASLGLIVHAIRLMGMLVVILDDPRWDLTRSVLLARPLWEC